MLNIKKHGTHISFTALIEGQRCMVRMSNEDMEIALMWWTPSLTPGGKVAFVRSVKNEKGGWTKEVLHRVIAGASEPHNKVVFLDGDYLNLRRGNLQVKETTKWKHTRPRKKEGF